MKNDAPTTLPAPPDDDVIWHYIWADLAFPAPPKVPSFASETQAPRGES